MMIKIGDVVNQKLGDPLMTVARQGEPGSVLTSWFDAEGEFHEASFEEDSLVTWTKANE